MKEPDIPIKMCHCEREAKVVVASALCFHVSTCEESRQGQMLMLVIAKPPAVISFNYKALAQSWSTGKVGTERECV